MIAKALVFPDLHAPYQHPDTLPFLYRIKDRFGPFDGYYCLGDETDGHAWSYHPSDPSLANSDLEFERAKKFMQQMYDFTEHKCMVMMSNHGSLAYRKAKTGMIPTQIMRGAYERALEAPPQWVWVPNYTIETLRGPVFLHHGFQTPNTWQVAKERGISMITGHHHTKFSLHTEYLPALKKQIFAMQPGCLIDPNSPAFSYAEGSKEKQKLGACVLIDGIPILIPMKLNDLGRWVGHL